LAQELFQLNLRYQALTKALSPLEQERDAYMTKVAENELACARNVHALTSENRATIDKLNQELSAKHLEIANKQNELQTLNGRLNSIRSEMETRVAQLNTALSAKTTELASLQSTVDHQVKMAQDKQRMVDLNLQSERSKLDFAFRQRSEALQAKYEAMIREQSDKQQNAAHQIALQKQEMEANQRRLANAQASVDAQSERLNQLKATYDAKMAEFDRQENQLRTLQLATQDKYEQILTRQKDTQARIEALQNAAKMERAAANARETKLRGDLDVALKDRAFIQKSYEECAVARDAILGKVSVMQSENNDLKIQLTSLQAQFDAVKAQHAATLDEMRRKVVESQSGLERCANSLTDASQVHEHVKRLAEENRRVTQEAERQLAKVADSEKAMRTLMTDKVRASEEVLRLQAALKECAASKSALSNQVASSASRVQALQRMDSALASTLETTSADFTSALRKRDAEMAREEIKRKAKEKEMQGKLARLLIEKQGLEQRLAKEERRHRSTEDLLVENVIDNAATIEGLLGSR
jgi:chromosome segregation ATPase